MQNERIRLSTTIPGMKDKIHTKIIDDTDKIYWYIKFNTVLNKASVTNKTMEVIDTDGFIMRTYIAYDTDRNVIVVSPIDSYISNKYYILSISKKVKSERGQHLKKEIHILFKLVNNKISKYEILKSTAKIPQSKPRPDNYDDIMSKIYSFSNEEENDIGKDILSYENVRINLLWALPGIVFLVVSMFLGALILFIISAILCAVGFISIAKQISNNQKRSVVYYNIGAFYFNKEKYNKAETIFKKSVSLDKNNEQAEYALTKVKFYL